MTLPRTWRSLRARVLLLNTLLAVIVAATVSVVFILAIGDLFRRNQEDAADSLAKSLALRVQLPMLLGDHEQVRKIAEETMTNADIVFVLFEDSDGKVTRSTRSGFPARALPAHALPESVEQTAPSAWTRTNNVSLRNGRFVEAERAIEAPAMRDLLGMEQDPKAASIGGVRVGLSLDRADAMARSAVLRSLLIVLGCLLLILLLESRKLQQLFSPLRELAQFAGGIGESNLNQRAAVKGADETAELATAFNGMLDRLAATLVSKEMAEQASQAKGRFLATAGHELRTPLNAIIGYSELLIEECEDRGLSDIIADLRHIRGSGHLLLELMNDLLDYSKAESGRMEVRLQRVQVAQVLQEVAVTVQPMARKNGSMVIVEAPDTSVMVQADPGRFRQSLLNLASNACKFTENGQIIIRAQALADAQRCDIAVQDTGIGIAPAEVGKLFEAFVQLDSSATRKYGGTGLGLAISRKFCQMMGGDIQVQSELGRGSIFTISLPLAESTPQEMPRPVETNQ
jgi:signal transduction histidine kinase